MSIDINGEQLTAQEAADLIKMLCHDAEEFAGEFHNMERSEKFRLNWPDEQLFAKANWKTFVEPVRMLYAMRLGDPKTPPSDARKMHLALVLQAKMAEGQETDQRLQIAPDSGQFHGDKAENRKILEKFGKNQNFRANLMNGCAKFARH